MRIITKKWVYLSMVAVSLLASCTDISRDNPPLPDPEPEQPVPFYFGADLSYVNQILDHGGLFKANNETVDPYEFFSDNGTDIARFRLWHHPTWTQEVYGEEGTQLYNDLADVVRSIESAKNAGMQVLLDFHYSDDWADPGTQQAPSAWRDITDLEVLGDSVYLYTRGVLSYLNEKGLMPEYVQTGNEINCGMFFSSTPAGFPSCNVCDGNWSNLALVLNKAIQAIREVNDETQVILHVADPANVDWWFENVMENGVRNFDVIGFSYYPLWHTEIGLNALEQTVAGFKSSFDREVMILETAYPWTLDGNDDYSNLFGSQQAVSGYPFTSEGQLALMKELTQNLIDGGGIGIFYWEPAWITSDLKDQWGTGSSWENNAFFDFDGNANTAIDYQSHDYGLDEE